MKESLAGLPGHQLLAQVLTLVRKGNVVEAEMLAHLGEVDARRLYLEQGCSSMFVYCQRALHFAEAVAYKRIQAARAVRRHPELLKAVREGRIHVTGAGLLAPKLTPENRNELIRAATHRSADEIRRLLADREPKPDAPATMRRLPTPATPAPRAPGAAPPSPAPDTQCTEPQPRPRREALGGERFAIQFTADRELHEQIQELRALLRHQIPDGDIGKVLARAVGVLLRQVRARKFGESTTAGSQQPDATKRDGRPRGRHIPVAIRRAVSLRDGERCTYVSESGRRCGDREFLEFDHREPWARRKAHSIEGLRLRCRAHNQLAAREAFGERHMARFGKQSKSRAGGNPADTRQLDSNPVDSDAGGRTGADA